MHTGYFLDLANLRKDWPEADFGYLENEFAGTDVCADTFLHGYCDLFACELSRAFGYGIEEIRDFENHLIHAYCVVNEGSSENPAYIDIRGITTDAEEFFAEFNNFINVENGQIDPSLFEESWITLQRFPDAESYMAQHPVLDPGTSSDLEESAKSFIANNAGFYSMDLSREGQRERAFRIFDPRKIGDLYHVGTMDISKKSRFSHEGNGLSVSNCPDDWAAITEGFTHGDYFKLSKPGMMLLDYYGLTDEEKKIIQAWAIENGYVQEGTLYKSLSCDEDGRELFSLHASYDVAFEEAGEEEECVEEVPWLLPTEKLVEQSLVRVEFLDIPDIITALYAEQVLEYDGIYWDEDLDVSRYSAPRGVIFNSKVPTFDVINTTKEREMSPVLGYEITIDASKMTPSARISVIWDSFGIAVDFNYSYDEAQGYGESVLCYCETYADGAPDEAAWREAQGLGLALKNQYNLPLDIAKDEMFLSSKANLDAQLRLQSEIKALYQEQEKLERELQAEYEDGETDWAAQLEVKLEDLERQIVGREELLKQLTAATVKPSLAYQIQSAATRGAESCLADKALVKLPGNER